MTTKSIFFIIYYKYTTTISIRKGDGMQESGRLRHDADTSDRHHNKAKNIAMTISLPPDIYDKLIDYSTEKGRTRAGMVRYIIERYMTGKPLESVSKT